MLTTSVSFYVSNLDTNMFPIINLSCYFTDMFYSLGGIFSFFLNEVGSHEDLVQGRAAACLVLFFVFC